MGIGFMLSLVGAAMVATLSGLGTAWGVSIPGFEARDDTRVTAIDRNALHDPIIDVADPLPVG